MVREQRDIFLFISGDKWYVSREGNKEMRATREGVDESLKFKQEKV